MLYWICPECGHECSPAVRECPTCTAPPAATAPPAVAAAPAVQEPIEQPVRQRTSASWELLALAENFQSRSSVALLTDAALLPDAVSPTAAPIEPKPFEPKPSQRFAPLDNMAVAPARPARSEPVNGSVSPVPVGLLATTFPSLASLTASRAEPKLSQRLAPLDNLAVKPASPSGLAAVTQSPAPVPLHLSFPVVLPAATPTRAEPGLVLAGPTPVGEISFQSANDAESGVLEPTADPLPSGRRSVAFVRAHIPGPDHSGMPFADLAQVSGIQLKPAVPSLNGQPKNHGQTLSGPLAYGSSAPVLAPPRLKLAGESFAELLNALKMSAEERDRGAIQAIESSFREKPAVPLLSAPAEIVEAPAPPARQWMRSEKPIFTAVAPENMRHAAVAVGPRTPTLAGPSLPPQLLNLDLRNSSLRHRKRAYSWLISLLVAIVFTLGVVALLQYVMQDRDTTAASTAAPVRTVKAASVPLRVAQEHPAARSVEVAGVRIVAGPNKKPQLEYVVINHSAGEITGLNIRIAVRSAEAPADAPLFTVSNGIASLGPNQSKEIRTDLDPSIQPSAIPDWQSLRTEVLVGHQ